MSFMNTVPQPKIAPINSLFKEFNKKDFPDGTYYFLLGAGRLNGNEPFWTDSLVGENKETVPCSYSSFWVSKLNEAGELKNFEIKWLTNFVGENQIAPNDPTILLGLNNRDMDMHRKVYPQTSMKIKTLPNHPEVTVWIPVYQLNTPLAKKGNLSVIPEGKVVHLGVTKSVYGKILEASKKVATALMEDNTSMFGRMISVTINRTLSPNDMYKIEPTPIILKDAGLEEFYTKMDQERLNIIEYIEEKTFKRVNGGEGGEQGATNVWSYICDTLGMKQQDVINKYYVGKPKVTSYEVIEEVDLSTMGSEEVDLGDE